MFKRQAIAAAVLAAQSIAASAAPAIAADPWVFSSLNPVAEKSATVPGARQAEIRMDPWVFFAPNPVAGKARAEATRKAAQLVQVSSDAHYYPGGISW